MPQVSTMPDGVGSAGLMVAEPIATARSALSPDAKSIVPLTSLGIIVWR